MGKRGWNPYKTNKVMSPYKVGPSYNYSRGPFCVIAVSKYQVVQVVFPELERQLLPCYASQPSQKFTLVGGFNPSEKY